MLNKYTMEVETDQPVDVVETPWFLHLHDEKIVNVSGFPCWQRLLVISTSPEKGQGQIVNTAGPFVAGDPELERHHNTFEYLLEIHNGRILPKPRNVNQTRDGTGKFVRKAPQNP